MSPRQNLYRLKVRNRQPLKHQVHAQLQETRAAYRVLNQAQAALRRNRCRAFVIGEERHVVVGGIEIGVVEDIERIRFEPQMEALFDLELLGQVHVETHLERASENVTAGASEQGFEIVTSGTIARGDAIAPWRYKLWRKISRIKLTDFRRNSLTVCTRMRCLRSSCSGDQWHDGIPNIVAGAVIEARNRSRKIIDAVRLSALRYGLSANRPAIC